MPFLIVHVSLLISRLWMCLCVLAKKNTFIWFENELFSGHSNLSSRIKQSTFFWCVFIVVERPPPSNLNSSKLLPFVFHFLIKLLALFVVGCCPKRPYSDFWNWKLVFNLYLKRENYSHWVKDERRSLCSWR